MDFSQIVIRAFASIVVVGQRVLLLLLYPYKTMRRVVEEQDWWPMGVIVVLVYIYFLLAHTLRPFYYDPSFLFFATIVHIILSVWFFTKAGSIFNRDIQFTSVLTGWMYSLIPTLIWFITTSVLYAFLPPPRTLSMLGKAFSIIYIAFSLSLLLWKIMLWYLTIRFAAKLPLYRIVYLMFLYLAIAGPYVVLLYYIHLFRVPFI